MFRGTRAFSRSRPDGGFPAEFRPTAPSTAGVATTISKPIRRRARFKRSTPAGTMPVALAARLPCAGAGMQTSGRRRHPMSVSRRLAQAPNIAAGSPRPVTWFAGARTTTAVPTPAADLFGRWPLASPIRASCVKTAQRSVKGRMPTVSPPRREPPLLRSVPDRITPAERCLPATWSAGAPREVTHRERPLAHRGNLVPLAPAGCTRAPRIATARSHAGRQPFEILRQHPIPDCF